MLLFFLFLLLFSFYAYAGTISTSSITAQTIMDRAKWNLNATYQSGVTDLLIDDNSLIQWTDEAVRETVNLTRCLESGPVDIALTESTRRYSSGVSFLDIAVVEHDTGVTESTRDTPRQIFTLDRVHKNDIGHNKETGRPKVYCVYNDYIEIFPIPRAEESGTTLHIYYVDLPAGVGSGTSAIETPAYLDNALTYYVTAMGFFKKGLTEKGTQWMTLYDQRVKEYLVNVLRRQPVE